MHHDDFDTHAHRPVIWQLDFQLTFFSDSGVKFQPVDVLNCGNDLTVHLNLSVLRRQRSRQNGPGHDVKPRRAAILSFLRSSLPQGLTTLASHSSSILDNAFLSAAVHSLPDNACVTRLSGIEF